MGFVVFVIIPILLIVAIIMIRNSIVRYHNATIRAWSDVASYERQKLKILDGLHLWSNSIPVSKKARWRK